MTRTRNLEVASLLATATSELAERITQVDVPRFSTQRIEQLDLIDVIVLLAEGVVDEGNAPPWLRELDLGNLIERTRQHFGWHYFEPQQERHSA